VFDSTIDSIIKSCADSLIYADYTERLKENKEWNSRRKVKAFSVGMNIDFRSLEFIWSRARIKRIIFRGKNNPKHLLISYESVS